MALTRPAIGRPESEVGMQDEIDAIRFTAEQGDTVAQTYLEDFRCGAAYLRDKKRVENMMFISVLRGDCDFP